jgi:hypothetical protein
MLRSESQTATAKHHIKSASLTKGLEKRLCAYVLAAGATGAGLVATAQPASAEIVFTPANITLTNGTLLIDLNHDGIADFALVDFEASHFLRFLDLNGNGNAGASVVDKSVYAQPNALSSGVVIGASDAFVNIQHGSVLMASAHIMTSCFSHCTYIYGIWGNVNHRFLGLRFEVKGQTHYGWARLSVRTTGPLRDLRITVKLTGYAYETVAGQSILAGQRSGTPDNPVFMDGAAKPNDSASVETPIQPGPDSSTLGSLALGSASPAN